MAVIVDIADAVVAQLNASTLSQPVTAERHYLPTFELPDMATLHVSVVPKSSNNSNLDRSRNLFTYEIDVAVQKKTDGSHAELDGLMTLSEEITDLFNTQPLSAYPNARCTGVETAPVYSAEHLEQLRQFTSLITLTFKLAR